MLPPVRPAKRRCPTLSTPTVWNQSRPQISVCYLPAENQGGFCWEEAARAKEIVPSTITVRVWQIHVPNNLLNWFVFEKSWRPSPRWKELKLSRFWKMLDPCLPQFNNSTLNGCSAPQLLWMLFGVDGWSAKGFSGSKDQRVGWVPPFAPPQNWQWIVAEGELPELRYCGKKPVPPKVSWEAGYQPLLCPASIMAGDHKCAFHPFTREFYHPCDRVAKEAPATADRFFQDSRRFPPASYSEHSLVWRGSDWRQPSPNERSQLMGVPPSAVRVNSGTPVENVKAANSLVGNGFHIPCILALLSCLPQLLAYKIPPPLTAKGELLLKERLTGTVWEPGRLEALPDLLTAEAVLNQVRTTFQPLALHPSVWAELLPRLQACRLSRFQYFGAWMRQRGREWSVLGPTPIAARERAHIYSGLSGQRFPSDSAKGLDHLIRPGQGKEAHLQQSAHLPSPFAPKLWPEPDVEFVVDTLSVWQEYLPQFAAEQRRIVESLTIALTPLEFHLDAVRCPSSRKVAAQKRPGFVAFLTALLRWPDTQQSLHMVQGYNIVGEFACTGLFRPLPLEDAPDLQQWLGPAAQEAVDDILARGPPRFHEDILRLTREEQQAGFCGPFLTRAEVDAQFGPGQWRPLERFLIQQPDGKQRVIDNARRTGHNSHTTMLETITTVNIDCIPAFARMVCEKLAIPDCPQEHYSWLQLRVATDDLPDAYRGLPVAGDQMAYSHVAVFVEGQWRFTPLFGLAYGLESAVVNFNRLPQLGVAAARRVCASFAAAYFDDELSIEFCAHSAVSSLGLQLVFRAMGAPPQAAKSFHPGTDRHYLGASVHVGQFAQEGSVRFQPKTSTVCKIQRYITCALKQGTMDRDTAGKLRGDLNWMFSNCAGHIGKFAGPLLTALQKADSPQLDQKACDTLQILLRIVTSAPPRDLPVCGPLPEVLRVYSDASFENSILRLGWVCFSSEHPPIGGSSVVPPNVIRHWESRHQQIFPGETICGLVVPWVHPELFQNQDVVWFIDNEAAAACLIRGGSKQGDVHLLAQYAQLLCYSLKARLWIEWIDSESNPSDGLSRQGTVDPWTVSQGWQVQEYLFPSDLLPDRFLASFESRLGSIWQWVSNFINSGLHMLSVLWP